MWSFDVDVLNCDEWFARVNVCVKLIAVVDLQYTQHLFYPFIGAMAVQAKLQAELAAVPTRAAAVCACAVLYSLACSFVNVMLCAHRLLSPLLLLPRL